MSLYTFLVNNNVPCHPEVHYIHSMCRPHNTRRFEDSEFFTFSSFIPASIFILIEDTSCSSTLLTGCRFYLYLSLPNGHIFDKPETGDVAVQNEQFYMLLFLQL